MPPILVSRNLHPTPIQAVAAAVNAAYRLCLLQPVIIVGLTDRSITLRTTHLTRGAAEALMVAIRDDLGPDYVMTWGEHGGSDHGSLTLVYIPTP